MATAVEDILNQLLGLTPSSTVKLLLITEAIGYLAGLGYTVTDGGANNTDWALARVCERLYIKKQIHERAHGDPNLLSLIVNYPIMTKEIERLLSQTTRKTYVKAMNFKPISSTSSHHWTSSSS